jgi:hypothetical protein
MLKNLPLALAATSLALGTGARADTPMEWTPEDFDAATFSNPTDLTNAWFSFEPGRQWIWDGTTVDDEGEELPHRVVITCTNLIKEIGGIPCVVTYDLDFEEDELIEAENAYFAQDDDGNVWRMGEYPEEYDEGKIEAAPTWLHGVDGAVAGITMLANPEVGTPGYSEGWAPSIDFTDRGRVREYVDEDCVPVDCYKNVLVVEETSADEVGFFQLKYWAKGAGNTRVSFDGPDHTKERLELVSLKTLDAKAMEKIHAKSMALEESAYEHSKGVFEGTAPMTMAK